MPINFASPLNAPVSMLTEWSVADADQLANAIAWLYVQKRDHAARIIQALEPGAAALPGSVVQDAIRALTVETADLVVDLQSADDATRKSTQDKLNVRIVHRDGLLFQHVSWIAAYLALPNTHSAPPHVRTADKGFDGVILDLDPAAPGLSRIILCEDKASTNPRNLVTQSIWPEITTIQAAGKDREILAAITAILATLPGVDSEAVIAATAWEGARAFRVALTADPAQARDASYAHLFAGFDDVAGGAIESRMAEVMPVQAVRPYLAALANAVILKLQAMG